MKLKDVISVIDVKRTIVFVPEKKLKKYQNLNNMLMKLLMKVISFHMDLAIIKII